MPEPVVACRALVEVQQLARTVDELAATADEEAIGEGPRPLELAGLPRGVLGHPRVLSQLPWPSGATR